jgi:hypothetical protein
MNLHGIATGVISAVNPQSMFTIQRSAGYATQPGGQRVPAYESVQRVGQMQAMSGKDLRQVEALNLNGTLRAIYFYGEVDAIVRSARKGGDKIIDDCGRVWLVAQVLEQWKNWCKIVVVLQNGS